MIRQNLYFLDKSKKKNLTYFVEMYYLLKMYINKLKKAIKQVKI